MIGRFCDRVQARRAVVLTGALGTALLLAATAIRGFWSFLIVVTLVQMAVQAAWICREALVADLTGEGGRVALSSRLRSLFNAGIIAGTALSGLLLSADHRRSYLALMLGCALAELIAVLLSLRLPEPGRDAPSPAVHAMRGAIRDVPYLTLRHR